MPDKGDGSQLLSEAMRRAMEACSAKMKRLEAEATTLYTIDIPAQQLFITDKKIADFTVGRLRDVGVRGTYRVTKTS